MHLVVSLGFGNIYISMPGKAANNPHPIMPFWSDLPDVEADITSDDPTVNSTAQKVTAAKQIVRKSFVHASWSEMSLASELSGSDALVRVQSRIQAYWDRQWEKRLIASLMGVLYSNVANLAQSFRCGVSSAWVCIRWCIRGRCESDTRRPCTRSKLDPRIHKA